MSTSFHPPIALRTFFTQLDAMLFLKGSFAYPSMRTWVEFSDTALKVMKN